MVDVTSQTQIIREAPDLEAEKLGLIDSAKALVAKGINLPIQQVAGMTDQQKDAIKMAETWCEENDIEFEWKN